MSGRIRLLSRCPLLALALLLVTCRSSGPLEVPQANPVPVVTPGEVIPLPTSFQPGTGAFILTSSTRILIDPADPEMTGIGQYLAGKLVPSTGYPLQVLPASGVAPGDNISLTTVGGDPSLGEEGYELIVSTGTVMLRAHRPAGLFRGVQTIRQLLPCTIECTAVQPGPWSMAACTVRDHPRFEWRGAMLDVARHFFPVADVERFIDLLAYYKMNRFHIHLSDDQGWRIAITSWPNLAAFGGSTQVGGGPGGYLTQADYAEIVAYADRRYITVVPEVDMPGHVNAALASYAVLNCSGVAPPLYTGINVGFSALCIGNDTTYSFVNDVVREVAALTSGPFFHIGGDEAPLIAGSEYARFIDSVQTIVRACGKQLIGWEEISQADLLPQSVAQHWASSLAQQAVQKGAKVIMSPADRAYMDMMYDHSTPIGQNWAGYIEVDRAYSWDPATQVTGVTESDILGLEAPLWTETIGTMADIEYMAFPRIPGYAEIGWSASAGRSWEEYRIRLGAHGPRLNAMAVNFYRSPLVEWK